MEETEGGTIERELTTIEKNVLIVKMLGWNKQPYIMSNLWHISENIPAINKMFGDLATDEELSFHNDANWQFEALDYLQREHKIVFEIYSGFDNIENLNKNQLTCWADIIQYKDSEKNNEDVSMVTGDYLIETEYYTSSKEATFEGLVMLAKYLEKKD